MPIYKGIRVKTDYSKMPHTNYGLFVAGVYENLLDNPYFRKPPVDLPVLKVKSTTETSGVGTRKAMPVSLPFNSGSARVTALAAPVEAGMMF